MSKGLERKPGSRPMRGASILEVSAALAVFAILLGVAMRDLGSWMSSTELANHANAMLLTLQLARSEAVKRNARVAACKSADGQSCATEGGWEQGVIVFHDANNNALRDPAEEVIRREAPLPAGVVVTGNQNVRNYVSYGPDGRTRLDSGAFQAGTLTACRRSDQAADARQVVVNAGGRPRLQRASLAACP